jgi:hypothetical protein
MATATMPAPITVPSTPAAAAPRPDTWHAAAAITVRMIMRLHDHYPSAAGGAGLSCRSD